MTTDQRTPTLDWKNIGFSYHKTAGHVVSRYKDGKWSEPCFTPGDALTLSVAAPALNYGQAIFEGMKAFHQQDGKVRIFRMASHCQRFESAAERLLMPVVPFDLFKKSLDMLVQGNREFVPPLASGGAFYLRPMLLGVGTRLGLGPADEYVFVSYGSPVGDYYKSGVKAVTAVVLDQFDRAAPGGVGNVKVSGNYAQTLLPSKIAGDQGFPIVLYLDSKEHHYIEEFGTSNFVAISPKGEYLTPDSNSILPSITNLSLQQIAADFGMPVIKRRIALEEVAGFSEVGACGTAVVITPVNHIVRGERHYAIGSGEGFGPILHRLYSHYRSLQTGQSGDLHGWFSEVPGI